MPILIISLHYVLSRVELRRVQGLILCIDTVVALALELGLVVLLIILIIIEILLLIVVEVLRIFLFHLSLVPTRSTVWECRQAWILTLSSLVLLEHRLLSEAILEAMTVAITLIFIIHILLVS